MKSTTLFRIASVVLILYAAGHTFGSLSFKAPTAEAQAVRTAMDNVKFSVDGSTFSFGDSTWA